jgi:Uncharacterized protein family, UPF0114
MPLVVHCFAQLPVVINITVEVGNCRTPPRPDNVNLLTRRQTMANQRTPPESPPSEPLPLLFRVLGSTRYVFLLAILSTYAATVVLLVLGAIEMIETTLAVIGVGKPLTAVQVRLHVIEAVDLFLIATILYVISGGRSRGPMARRAATAAATTCLVPASPARRSPSRP